MNTNKHINSIITNGGGGTLTSRKLAFSLAEVTLAVFVLGIIAAETIPVLLKDYQKKVWETQYKTAYSIIKQATTNIMADNGGTLNGAWSNKDEFYEAYTRYFKIAVDCKDSFPLIQSACFNNTYRNLKGDSISPIGGYDAVMLTNGISIAFQNVTNPPVLHIDTNGPKGPNVYGKDFHTIELYTTSNDPVKPQRWDWWSVDINKQCLPDLSSGSGKSCGVRILRGDYGEEY